MSSQNTAVPGKLEEVVASSTQLAQCCFMSWMDYLCFFSLSGSEQEAQVKEQLLPGFACG